MRKVLIAGQHSFIGTAVVRASGGVSRPLRGKIARHARRRLETVRLFALRLRRPRGRHRPRVAQAGDAPLYESVNRDLAVACARRAREMGVKQFIYLSSAIVFGDAAPAGGTWRDRAGDLALARGRLWPQQAGGRARPARAGKRALPRDHPAADDGLWQGLQGQLQRPCRPRPPRAAVFRTFPTAAAWCT